MANVKKIERSMRFEHEVICQICGYTNAKTIQGHIRWKHPEISIQEYMSKFDAEIMSEDEKKIRAEKTRQINTGRACSEETRAKMSKSHVWSEEQKKAQGERMKIQAQNGTHPAQQEYVREKARQNAILRNKTDKQMTAVKEALTGRELSEETRKKISDGHIGLKQSMETCEKRGRVLRRLHSEGKMPLGHKRGIYHSTKMNRDFVYRSSYELRYYEILDNDDSVITWDAECLKIPYLFEGKCHTYFPDVFVNGNEVHEVKPLDLIDTPQNLAKQSAAEAFCRDKNWNYKLITEDDLITR